MSTAHASITGALPFCVATDGNDALAYTHGRWTSFPRIEPFGSGATVTGLACLTAVLCRGR